MKIVLFFLLSLTSFQLLAFDFNSCGTYEAVGFLGDIKLKRKMPVLKKGQSPNVINGFVFGIEINKNTTKSTILFLKKEQKKTLGAYIKKTVKARIEIFNRCLDYVCPGRIKKIVEVKPVLQSRRSFSSFRTKLIKKSKCQ